MQAPDSVDSYVLCFANGGYLESLEVRKIYAVLLDERTAANDYVRVIDESGSDYLYPAKYFVPINLLPEVAADRTKTDDGRPSSVSWRLRWLKGLLPRRRVGL